MAEQVYEIAALKKRVIELLRGGDGYLAAGTVATQLGVPLYAANAALEAASRAGEVQHSAGAGWHALGPSLGRVEPLADEGQGSLLAGGA